MVFLHPNNKSFLRIYDSCDFWWITFSIILPLTTSCYQIENCLTSDRSGQHQTPGNQLSCLSMPEFSVILSQGCSKPQPSVGLSEKTQRPGGPLYNPPEDFVGIFAVPQNLQSSIPSVNSQNQGPQCLHEPDFKQLLLKCIYEGAWTYMENQKQHRKKVLALRAWSRRFNFHVGSYLVGFSCLANQRYLL